MEELEVSQELASERCLPAISKHPITTHNQPVRRANADIVGHTTFVTVANIRDT